MRTRRHLAAGRTFFLPAVLALTGWAGVGAQEAARVEALPSARSLIDTYVVALGGKQAFLAVQSMKMTGRIEFPAAGIAGSLEIQAMPPNKILLVVDIPGLGKILEGFDGQVAWSIDPNMGPRVKDGDELKQSRFLADFYGPLHAEGRFQSMETLEKTALDGVPCYKVRLVTRDGDETFEYFDVASGLMVASEMAAKTAMGTLNVLSKIADYTTIGSVKLPARMSQKIGPMEQTMTMSDIELDAVDPAAFELPAEIRALVAE